MPDRIRHCSTPHIVQPSHEVSTENPPRPLSLPLPDLSVSGSTVSTSRSHQYGSAAFLQRAAPIQEFLIAKAKSPARSDPTRFWSTFDASGFTEKSLIVFAHFLVKKFPSDLAENIQNLGISEESARFKLACCLAAKEPNLLAENIQNFALSNESNRIALARSIAKKAGGTLSRHIASFVITDQSTLVNLYATAYLGHMLAIERSVEDEEVLPENFFPGDAAPVNLLAAASRFGNHHPVITALLYEAQKEPDKHNREALSTWTHLVSLLFADAQLTEAAWQALKPSLEAIQKWGEPTTRYALTQVLAQQSVLGSAEDAKAFLALAEKFTRPHTRLYPVLLFPLFQAASDDPALQRLTDLLHRPHFKDVKLQHPVVSALLALVQADRMTDELKRWLLQTCLPDGAGKEDALALAQTASALECLTSLAQQDTELGDTVLERLTVVRKPSDFDEQMTDLFQELFQRPHFAGGQFSRYRERSRQSAELVTNAGTVQNQGIQERQQESSMATPTAQRIFNAGTRALSAGEAKNRANLMSLIRLRGAVLDVSGSPSLIRKNTDHHPPAPDPNPNPAMRMRMPPSVDINIHGTLSHGSWVPADSAFSQNVRRRRNAITTNFQWSGSPLEAQRQTGGVQLESFIRDVKNPFIAKDFEVNVLAHSHGGNVLGHALSRQNVSINKAILLGTPHMYDANNVNISWTRQGTDQVQGMIASFSAPNDVVQITGANIAEWAQGNFGRGIRRNFQRSDALTPLFNFNTPALGANAPRQMPVAVQAHRDLHQSRMGNQINITMRFVESPFGRRFLQTLRGMNIFRRRWGLPNNPIERNIQV